mgnify:CR=1 FL=1
MNTKDSKVQWHPAFDAALQIELGDEAKYLTFEPEHLLSKKPMQIDVLVKNEKNIKITKNIGRIFRQHNIVEYKSPEDYLNIDDFYKVYGYTCIYKTEVEKVNQIYEKNKDSKLFQALTDAVMRANWKEAEEERKKMNDVFKELFAKEFEEYMEEGRQKGKIELLIKKYKKGYTAEEAADALEEKTSIVQQIYDIIGQYAPDYDIEKICNAFSQKNRIQA